MAAEIGHFALILALVLALFQATVPLYGAARGDLALMAAGRAAATLQAGFIVTAFAALAFAFVRLDFSLAVVAANTHSTQPLVYRFAGVWGNHEGSMLLWVLILGLFGAGVAWYGDNLRASFQARVLAVQGMIGAAFLAFLLFTSNPFARLSPVPADGAELNPLLQDPGLVIHPPLLYLGYVGFSVAFAFAAAALIEGRVDAAWARWVRPWVLAAWVCLTCGITLGSVWAYYTLGWGGWWFWDPVENASLMPWLLGTALLHSALVLERRGALIGWTILLAILTFSLSLIGTFLVRSGILTSVHSFAVDPKRGVFILAIIVGATGGALALFAARAPAMQSGALFGRVSRETGLVLNNLFLLALTSVVFLGTFYPVIMEAFSTDKISVGPPYYALTFAPLAVPLLVLVVFGPMLMWKRDSVSGVVRRLRAPLVTTGVALAAGLALAGGKVAAAGGLALAVWLVMGAAAILVRRWSGSDTLRKVRTTPMSVYGLALAHAGLGVLVAGVTAVTVWQTSKILVMQPGQTIAIGPAHLRLNGMREALGPNYVTLIASFTLDRQGLRPLTSERRFYPASRTQTTQAGIASFLAGNSYVAVGELQGTGIVVRAYDHPLVGWIWAGAVMMAAGGMASLADRRFRVGAARPAAARLAVA
ncbi:MAG: heme lyase CcmF/NrfE family subunit [Sphingomonadaceae bacterium]|nr:heme lyase CcmF/NrfE family subunit [Sphingomonadaceae bacterium]